MNHVEYIIRILASIDSRLFMARNEYIAELAALVPFFLSKKEITNEVSYQQTTHKEFQKISETSGVRITDDYNSQEIDRNTLAYYRIKGMITADSCWRISTKQLEKDILAADANDNISGHFMHISSGGGEAWYLDQLASSIRGVQKPVYSFIEKVSCSAAYYIASQSDHISAATPYDLVGCIGTMISFMDIEPMLKKWGINFIKEFSKYSDLKNKKYSDLVNGKPEQFITEELDPLCNQFISDVKIKRSIIASLPDDHPILRGETYYTGKALEDKNGLIDAIETLNSALERAYAAATAWNTENDKRRKALRYLQ
jgi:ClpP class serine protease